LLEVLYRSLLLDFHLFIHNFKLFRNGFDWGVHVLMHDLRYRTILWQSFGNHSWLKILFWTGRGSGLRDLTSQLCFLTGNDKSWLIKFSFVHVHASIYQHIFGLGHGHRFQFELGLKFTNALIGNKFLVDLVESLFCLFYCQSITTRVTVAHLWSVNCADAERRIKKILL
jgi:hypothetical protein